MVRLSFCSCVEFWLSRPKPEIGGTTPAMTETMLPLAGRSPVNGKALSARFDGGALLSDAGLLALREVVLRLDVAGRLAPGIDDLRDPTRTVHSVADILR